jgi:hypothetical protein
MLEHSPNGQEDFAATYLDVVCRRHIELYQMFFEHGIHTLLTPVFGPDLMEPGDSYMQLVANELARPATHPEFISFYQTYGVRVRFYGDYRKYLKPTRHAHLVDQFDEATLKTQTHNRHRLLFGMFAHDAAETIADLAIEYYHQHQRAPNKRALIEMYYGEYVEPVDLFIGFDRFTAFDMPLVATGDEDLYFTVSPSPYFTQRQLREILYDHLYNRHDAEPHYRDMTPEDWELMRDFYRANLGKTQGIGIKHKRGGYWYPTPQVERPSGF